MRQRVEALAGDVITVPPFSLARIAAPADGGDRGDRRRRHVVVFGRGLHGLAAAAGRRHEHAERVDVDRSLGGGRICPVALVPCVLVTCTWTWQMSLVAFSPAYTPAVGSGAHAVPAEYAGGVAVMRFGLLTVKLVAATPPKVTLVAPVKPEPRIVTGRARSPSPPWGPRR